MSFLWCIHPLPPIMSNISGLKSSIKPTEWRQEQGQSLPTGILHALHLANVKPSPVQGFQLELGKWKPSQLTAQSSTRNSNEEWFGSVQSTDPFIFFFSSQNKPFSFPPWLILDPMKCFIQLQNEMSFQNISWNNIPFLKVPEKRSSTFKTFLFLSPWV